MQTLFKTETKTQITLNLPVTNKFFVWNGTLSLLHNNNNGFNANMLVGFSKTGIIKNLSFSFSGIIETKSTISMLTLVFPETSQHIDITFCLGKTHYCRSIELSKDILEKMSKNTISLYLYLQQQVKDHPEKFLNPKKLLQNILDCAKAHEKMLKKLQGTEEAIKETSPKFVESLANIFSEALENLTNEKNSLNSQSTSHS